MTPFSNQKTFACLARQSIRYQQIDQWFLDLGGGSLVRYALIGIASDIGQLSWILTPVSERRESDDDLGAWLDKLYGGENFYQSDDHF